MAARALYHLIRGGRRIAYGEAPDQYVEAHLPGGAGPHPAAIVFHGGSWTERWTLRYTRAIAGDLARRGFVVLNAEYRRLGGRSGGGWPQTFEDAAAATDLLATAGLPVDLRRVAAVGHSAGGHLALWAAARHRLPAGAPGGDPAVRPSAAVGLAALAELPRWAHPLLGGLPHEVPQRWAAASPASLLPLGVPILLVHGHADRLVPARTSERFARRARAVGDDVELLELAGSRHATFANPLSAAWRCAAGRLERWAAGGTLLREPGRIPHQESRGVPEPALGLPD